MTPHERWVEELDRLEAMAEPLRRGADVDWDEPADMPPLPADLAGRARSVLALQAAAREELEARVEQARREHGAAVALRHGRPVGAAAPSAYLDVTA